MTWTLTILGNNRLGDFVTGHPSKAAALAALRACTFNGEVVDGPDGCGGLSWHGEWIASIDEVSEPEDEPIGDDCDRQYDTAKENGET